jgi:hypothetical protein
MKEKPYTERELLVDAMVAMMRAKDIINRLNQKEPDEVSAVKCLDALIAKVGKKLYPAPGKKKLHEK